MMNVSDDERQCQSVYEQELINPMLTIKDHGWRSNGEMKSAARRICDRLSDGRLSLVKGISNEVGGEMDCSSALPK